MRITRSRALGAFLLALAAALASPAAANGPPDRGPHRAESDTGDVQQNSVMQVPSRAAFPLIRKAAIGVGKSMLVQFPFDLRDVLVSDPEKIDAVVQSADRVFLIAKKPGQTNAFFFDTNGQQIMTLEIAVGADLGALDALLRRLIPGSNIRTEVAGTAVVLTGFVRNPGDSNKAADIAAQFADANRNLIGSAYTSTMSSVGGVTTYQTQGNQQQGAAGKKVINLLTIEGEDQVMLKVTVAEVQRTVLKQFGINIGAAINAGNFSTTLLTENALPLTAALGMGTLPIPGVMTGVPAAQGSPQDPCYGTICNYNRGPQSSTYGNNGVSGGYGTGSTRISHALRAMERAGLIRTLAEPNLTAVSGETAKFLAGGEYPIPTVDTGGQLSVTFKEFGVAVAFTPVVLSEGRISLKIETEVSELSNEGAVTLSSISIPALKKRQAKSTVELPSGGSLALAGLISDSTRQNIDGFPGLKDVPVLGTLFRSRDFVKSETELVVIVTPYMARPTARQNLARPDDGFAPASDLKANFLGHVNRVYGKGRELPSGGLKGDYGFIVD